jgi:hypothetical protein
MQRLRIEGLGHMGHIRIDPDPDGMFVLADAAQAEIDRLEANAAAFTSWLDAESKDFAHPEYIATIERVRDKFLSLKQQR